MPPSGLDRFEGCNLRPCSCRLNLQCEVTGEGSCDTRIALQSARDPLYRHPLSRTGTGRHRVTIVGGCVEGCFSQNGTYLDSLDRLIGPMR